MHYIFLSNCNVINTTCPALANSVDPDQLASEEATDLDLHCCHKICEFLSKTRIK